MISIRSFNLSIAVQSALSSFDNLMPSYAASNSNISKMKAIEAIKSVAAASGADFSFMLQKAEQESSFNPRAKASTSSAQGLFQFTEQTWLSMVSRYGEEAGIGNLASKITKNSNGRFIVSDPSARAKILELRNDPKIASVMSVNLDSEHKNILQRNVGGKVGGTELYLAHFLGAGGAVKFLNEMKSNASANASDLLPEAAKANRSVFYNKDGSPKTVAEIYNRFDSKFGKTTAVAASKPAVPNKPIANNALGYNQMSLLNSFKNGSISSSMLDILISSQSLGLKG